MKTVLILFASFQILSCGKPAIAPAFDRATIRSQVKDMLDQYHQDIKESGLTAEFKYLDASEDFFWVPPGYESALSYDSVKTILENNAGSFSHIEFSWDTLQIFPLSAEIATYTGIVDGKMLDISGTENRMKILESGTLIKRKDGWKLLSGQSVILQ